MCNSCHTTQCKNPKHQLTNHESVVNASCCSSTSAATPPSSCSTTEISSDDTDDPAAQGCCKNTCSSPDNTHEINQKTTDAAMQFSWRVTNMDCPSCAGKLEKAISGIEGVVSANVLFATEKLVVTTDPSKDLTKAIKQHAEKAGFPLQELSAPKSKEVPKTVIERIKEEGVLASLIGTMVVAGILSNWYPELASGLFTFATVLGLIPIVKKAFNLAKSGSPFSIEMLMSIAAFGALYLGETVEAAMVLVLFLIGERLEGYASQRARAGIQALMALVPDNIIRIDSSGKREDVPVSSLAPGDVIEIAPGGRLPADATLQGDVASFDLSALTGESIPVERQSGEKVPAGAIAVDRLVLMEVVSKQGESAIDRILNLIEEAESRRAPVERFIDKFSRWYTPLMILVAALVVTIPPLMFGESWDTWVYRGLALLLIACPCALVISTPAAMTSGLAAAARQGALIKGGAALEALSKVEWVAFDKTGTLTQGKPVVTDILSWHGDQNELLSYAAAVEKGSHHPLAKALVEKAEETGVADLEATNITAQVGKGVSGDVNGTCIELIALDKLGEERVLAQSFNDEAQELAEQGKTVAVVFSNTRAVGVIAWRDELRPTAKLAVDSLNELGIRSLMLTGDNEKAAAGLASKLNMDYRAGLMPEDKVTEVNTLASSSRVAMVGDGINDAPAMKAATIGIAMGSGTDVALETADIALSHNRIESVADVVILAKATMSNVHQNVALAVGLKAIFLVTSVLGFTGLWVAVLADSGATAIVTLNALRLLRHGKDQSMEKTAKLVDVEQKISH
ncbi:zinc/cadmium/mercury/lead-transporting ATPase [Enterovibrio sp. ZSDZ35]|uniref:P-type Zn(2+) transporter n=1 Tax=Enterovibrio qingdaonensis TaxID=2899818 RepID=A0ABT5QP48_9GAMM|nr:zinc/cadmium/mercury/lead-transporting ATPase [Enterovibrio sp. ZSDZ35]MDD1782768.1 zinc/cadmium/mercury/lead-transporting ATPase [Enterovibrio sp. ZSDZ35]